MTAYVDMKLDFPSFVAGLMSVTADCSPLNMFRHDIKHARTCRGIEYVVRHGQNMLLLKSMIPHPRCAQSWSLHYIQTLCLGAFDSRWSGF
jgi:hypothetical protein